MSNPIRSFRDLEVFQNTYKAMLGVGKQIIPLLPDSERFDLKDQLSRSSKAIPRLIAEGYAKRHQKMGFQKYIDDAMGECNETIVSLEQARDLYKIDSTVTDDLVKTYDISVRQLYNLGKSWTTFKRQLP